MERIKGFTLIELVLAITLLGIIVVVSSVLMGRGVDAYRLVSERTDALQQARISFVRMQKEIETLRQVSVASPQRIVFSDPNLINVEFNLVGTTLYRDSDVVAEGVNVLQFTYYRDNGNETSSAPQVRRIHMEMAVQGGPTSGQLDLRTDVFPRIYIYENFQ